MNYHERYQFKDSTILTNEFKAYWILATIKLLALQYDAEQADLFRAIGKFYALLNYSSDLNDLLLDFRLLEVQLYLLLYQQTGELIFNKEAYDLIVENTPTQEGRPPFQFLQFNMLLAVNSLNYWHIVDTKQQYYRKLHQLQLLIFFFQIDFSIARLNLPEDKKLEWRTIYLDNLIRYHSLTKNFKSSLKFLFEKLKLIEEKPSIFDATDLYETVDLIYFTLKRLGKPEEANKWKSPKPSQVVSYLDNYNEVPVKFKDIPPKERKEILNLFLSFNWKKIYAFSDYMGEANTRAFITLMIEYVLDRYNYKSAYHLLLIKYYLLDRVKKKSNRDFTKIVSEQYVFTLKEKLNTEILSLEKNKNQLNRENFNLQNEVGDQIDKLFVLDNSISKKTFEIDELEKLKNSLSDTILMQETQKAQIQREKAYWEDTSSILTYLNDSITRINTDLDSARVEIQKKKDEVEHSYNNVLTGFIIAGILAILVLFLWQRTERQKKDVVKQSIISDSLRQSVGQIAHLSKDTIGAFASDQFKEENISDDSFEQLMKLQTFMVKIHENNLARITEQNIEDEIIMSMLSIQSNYYDPYGTKQLSEIIQIDNGLNNLTVPLYTILNIINNSFKHSTVKAGVKIKIEKIDETIDFVRLKIQDIAIKTDNKKKENGTGEKYLENMLRSFNDRKTKPNLQTGFNELGYYVEFTIIKK